MFWVAKVVLRLMPHWLMRWLVRRYGPTLIARAKHTPYFPLPGYMDRYWLFKDFFGINARVHITYRSDYDRSLHDHPWDNISILQDGYYWEETFVFPPTTQRRLYMPGDVIVRNAEVAHRLELSSPVTTFFITFPWRRRWGFYTERGWVFWKDYMKGDALENELANESNR